MLAIGRQTDRHDDSYISNNLGFYNTTRIAGMRNAADPITLKALTAVDGQVSITLVMVLKNTKSFPLYCLNGPQLWEG